MHEVTQREPLKSYTARQHRGLYPEVNSSSNSSVTTCLNCSGQQTALSALVETSITVSHFSLNRSSSKPAGRQCECVIKPIGFCCRKLLCAAESSPVAS
jgi:hypothetical protein